MSEHHPISDLMTETMSKIKEMVDVNTIIGNPIVAADGTTVIPVSKVSFGFGAGGSEFASKHAASGCSARVRRRQRRRCDGFAGVLPCHRQGRQRVNILGINAQASDTVDRLVEMIPGAINRVSSFVERLLGQDRGRSRTGESAPMEGRRIIPPVPVHNLLA